MLLHAVGGRASRMHDRSPLAAGHVNGWIVQVENRKYEKLASGMALYS